MSFIVGHGEPLEVWLRAGSEGHTNLWGFEVCVKGVCLYIVWRCLGQPSPAWFFKKMKSDCLGLVWSPAVVFGACCIRVLCHSFATQGESLVLSRVYQNNESTQNASPPGGVGSKIWSC